MCGRETGKDDAANMHVSGFWEATGGGPRLLCQESVLTDCQPIRSSWDQRGRGHSLAIRMGRDLQMEPKGPALLEWELVIMDRKREGVPTHCRHPNLKQLLRVCWAR